MLAPLEYRLGEQLGEGTFGTVHLGLNERTGGLFAVKRIRFARAGSGAGATRANAVRTRQLRHEIELLKRLDHKHIVRYLGTATEVDAGAHMQKALLIFLEYVPGGSIASMLRQFGSFNEALVRVYTHQILSGVAYLHERGIVHRDIKGANVLVNEHGIAKLADFGCSKQLQGMRTDSLEESLKAIRGSVPWMAPEVVKQTGHGRRADVWSVGCTVIEMATAQRPWPAMSNCLSAMFHIATASEPPPLPRAQLSPAGVKFLERCFIIDPSQRPSAQELMLDTNFIGGGCGGDGGCVESEVPVHVEAAH